MKRSVSLERISVSRSWEVLKGDRVNKYRSFFNANRMIYVYIYIHV